jgi:hypothetical protein
VGSTVAGGRRSVLGFGGSVTNLGVPGVRSKSSSCATAKPVSDNAAIETTSVFFNNLVFIRIFTLQVMVASHPYLAKIS